VGLNLGTGEGFGKGNCFMGQGLGMWAGAGMQGGANVTLCMCLGRQGQSIWVNIPKAHHGSCCVLLCRNCCRAGHCRDPHPVPMVMEVFGWSV
jgi:hypothetical protein